MRVSTLVKRLLGEGWFSRNKTGLFSTLDNADKVEVRPGLKRWEIGDDREKYCVYFNDGWDENPCITLSINGDRVGEVYIAGPGYKDGNYTVQYGSMHIISIQVSERRNGYATKLLQMAAKLNSGLDQISCHSTSRASADMVTKAYSWPSQSEARTADLPHDPSMRTGHMLLISGPNPYA